MNMVAWSQNDITFWCQVCCLACQQEAMGQNLFFFNLNSSQSKIRQTTTHLHPTIEPVLVFAYLHNFFNCYESKNSTVKCFILNVDSSLVNHLCFVQFVAFLSPQATRAIGAISLVTAAASAFSVLGLINTRSRNRPF